MDEIDRKILDLLAIRGRTSWAELAGVLGLSGPAAADRVRRLEARGTIAGYVALIDPTAVGYHLLAFIDVVLGRPEGRDAFKEWVRSCRTVQECHVIAGEFDYRLKVWCEGMNALEHFISDELRPALGTGRTKTTIVLSTTKDTPSFPVGVMPDSGGAFNAVEDGLPAPGVRRKRLIRMADRGGPPPAP